jgi:hypothetical protein
LNYFGLVVTIFCENTNEQAVTVVVLKVKGLKQWECVLVGHHSNFGRTIEEFESKDWNLHTYSAAQLRGSEINHYLLFEKGQ